MALRFSVRRGEWPLARLVKSMHFFLNIDFGLASLNLMFVHSKLAFSVSLPVLPSNLYLLSVAS